jgi:hypothetical protein
MFNKFPPPPLEIYAVCIRDNVEKRGTVWQDTDENLTGPIRFAYWITKATNTHSEYVILIAYPQQPWLRELATILRYRNNDIFVTGMNHYSYYAQIHTPLVAQRPH